MGTAYVWVIRLYFLGVFVSGLGSVSNALHIARFIHEDQYHFGVCGIWSAGHLGLRAWVAWLALFVKFGRWAGAGWLRFVRSGFVGRVFAFVGWETHIIWRIP